MRSLVLDEYISLDGFAADAAGGLDFAAPFAGGRGDSAREQLHAVRERFDAILLGAETFRQFREYWPTAASGEELISDWINTTPKYVVSNSIEDAAWGSYQPARVLRGAAGDAVAALKSEQGSDIVLWGSLRLAKSLLTAGLIDEIHLRVVPVALGSGTRFFPDGTEVPVRLTSHRAYGDGVVWSQYSVRPPTEVRLAP